MMYILRNTLVKFKKKIICHVMKMLYVPYQLLLEKFQYAFFLIGTFPLLKNQMKNHNGITMSNTGLMTHDICKLECNGSFVVHVVVLDVQ